MTRPLGQNNVLAECIQAAGHQSLEMPWLRIENSWSEPERLQWWEREAHKKSAFIFVSSAAVRSALSIDIVWPKGVWAIATGADTALALKEQGVPTEWIRYPATQFDSEGVWKECRECFLPNTVIVIFRGQAGRSWLGDQAIQVGCQVEYKAVYCRLPCVEIVPLMIAQWDQGKIDAIVLTNSEAIDAIGEKLPSELWARVPLFVPHFRIEATARRHGAQNVILTEGGNKGLCKALEGWLRLSV